MSIVTLITGLLKLAGALMDYAERKQLMDAGAAKELLKLSGVIHAKVQASVAARERVARDAADGGLHDDDGYRAP